MAEFSQIFGLLMIIYAFLRFLPRNRRIALISVRELVPMIIAFSYVISSYKNYFTDSHYLLIRQYLPLFSLIEKTLSSQALKSQGSMEFSLFFDFLKISHHSIKLILSKNGKLIASVTALSLLVPSILFSSFTHLYTHLINHTAKSTTILHYAPPLLAQAALFLACSVIFQLTAIAVISISAYHSNELSSLKDVFLKIRETWKLQMSNSFSRSRNPTPSGLIFWVAYHASCLATFVHVIPAVFVFTFLFPASAVWPLSSVVSVVEESSNGGEAAEVAERLVEGCRVHGFMLKLLFILNLVYSFVVGGVGGPKVELGRGLLRLNSLIMGRMAWCVLHTVLYFRCKKEIDAAQLGIGIN